MASDATSTFAALPDTQNQTWSKDKSKFGYQMLLKMGWSEGKGLGKKENGMLSHIKVAKKDDSTGLGLDERRDLVWLNATSAYNNILSNLKKVSSSATIEPASSSDSDSSSSDSDSDSSSSDSDSDSSSSSSSGSTTKAKTSLQVATKARYQRRIAGKSLSNFSSKQLAEIFGKPVLPESQDAPYASPYASPKPTPSASPKPEEAEESASGSESSDARETKSTKSTPAKEPKLKMKSLMKKHLSKAPEQSMKVKKFQKEVVKAAQAMCPSKSKDSLKSDFEKQLRSSAFVVEGKSIRLSA